MTNIYKMVHRLEQKKKNMFESSCLSSSFIKHINFLKAYSKYFILVHIYTKNIYCNMPFPPQKKQLYVLSNLVNLCTENHVLFFEENWILKAKTVYKCKYFVYENICNKYIEKPIE